MKVSSSTILHKSDLGLVKVGLSSPKEVKSAFDEIMDAAGAEGVLVSELASPGIETVVGVAQDELFGPTVMFGLGGVFVEVLKDVSLRLAPLSRADARQMVEELRGRAVLDGFRGMPAADLGAVEDALLGLSRLAVELDGRVSAVDVNPLIVSAEGAAAADALVVLAASVGPAEAARGERPPAAALAAQAATRGGAG
jgi:succinyl-CoA synthetase beta subunit